MHACESAGERLIKAIPLSGGICEERLRSFTVDVVAPAQAPRGVPEVLAHGPRSAWISGMGSAAIASVKALSILLIPVAATACASRGQSSEPSAPASTSAHA